MKNLTFIGAILAIVFMSAPSFAADAVSTPAPAKVEAKQAPAKKEHKAPKKKATKKATKKVTKKEVAPTVAPASK